MVRYRGHAASVVHFPRPARAMWGGFCNRRLAYWCTATKDTVTASPAAQRPRYIYWAWSLGEHGNAHGGTSAKRSAPAWATRGQPTVIDETIAASAVEGGSQTSLMPSPHPLPTWSARTLMTINKSNLRLNSQLHLPSTSEEAGAAACRAGVPRDAIPSLCTCADAGTLDQKDC